MRELLIKCQERYNTLDCCHQDSRICACSACLKNGFYMHPDMYNCDKKMAFYVLNYGPAYSSEIYHYLDKSKVLETLQSSRQPIKILSLGCGFAPDLVALTQYSEDKGLGLEYEYLGIDLSPHWAQSRFSTAFATFDLADVTKNVNLHEFDLIFIVKLFSTLKSVKQAPPFLTLLNQAITNQMKTGSYLVFNEVNHFDKGRDQFDHSVRAHFSQIRKYYYPLAQYHDQSWIQCDSRSNVINIPAALTHSPLPHVTNAICFEYRK